MRRDLPPRPNLDHLKKQAKDLLDAHKHAEPDALTRLREAMPSFAGMTDDEIARAPFALHDAQSALAREYGHKSWNDLRDTVVAKNTLYTPLPDELMRALMPLPFPASVRAALKDSWGRRSEAAAAANLPLAYVLPLVAMRNALFVPGAFAPINVGRAVSKGAIEAALARTPATLALFTQRVAAAEDVSPDSIYPVGCEAIVYARIPDEDDAWWVILEGVRWIAFESLERTPSGHLATRITPVALEETDVANVAELAQALRERARELASALPYGERVVAMIDTLQPGPLADLVIANLPVAVAQKARYASERRLPERLRVAKALADAQLAPTAK
jgi:hypothetical protein